MGDKEGRREGGGGGREGERKAGKERERRGEGGGRKGRGRDGTREGEREIARKEEGCEGRREREEGRGWERRGWKNPSFSNRVISEPIGSFRLSLGGSTILANLGQNLRLSPGRPSTTRLGTAGATTGTCGVASGMVTAMQRCSGAARHGRWDAGWSPTVPKALRPGAALVPRRRPYPDVARQPGHGRPRGDVAWPA